MKRVFAYLIVATCFAAYGFCKNGSSEINQNPNLSLNPQDVPLFHDNSPLIGMKAFNVITSFALKDRDMQNKIRQLIEKVLSGFGEVVHLKDHDMRGFGSGNVFLIQMGNVTAWDGNVIPISRLSLNIETFASLDKTGVKTFPMVWSNNTFVQGNIDTISEDSLTKAVQKLLGEFMQSYQYANRDQTQKPVFYIYN